MPWTSRSTIEASTSADPTSRAERRRLRRQWAKLIRHIYEVDPLRRAGGHEMRLVSFLTAPRVVRRILDPLYRVGAGHGRPPPDRHLEPQALAS